jgi:hypothetical protein
MYETEFLSRKEANEFYAKKSPHYEALARLPDVSLMKVYPGERYVLFTQDGTEIKIHTCLRANVIAMDREGVCVLLKDVDTDSHIRIGYIPTPVTAADGSAVFLSIPSHCIVDRTLRRSKARGSLGAIRESVATGLLVWQAVDPYDRIQEGVATFLTYKDFKRKTGRTISKLEEVR